MREPLPRVTRTEELRRQLADDIITGRILPGVRLDEQMLADRFGVSRTPVREALKHLAAIGLAEPGPQRSLVAATVSQDKMNELFEVMAELEATCARLAALRMNALERKQIEGLHLRAGHIMRIGNAADYNEANTAFHAAIYRGSHNRTLEELALNTRARLAPFRGGQFNVAGRLAKSYAEHDVIVTSILRGDAQRAYDASLAHVAKVSDASTEYVTAQDRLRPRLVARD